MTAGSAQQQLLWAAFGLFAVVMAFSPGPNNILLASSGANHGFRKTVPLMMGVIFGFPLMMLAVGVGLAGLFVKAPVLQLCLRAASAAYLLWMAWAITRAGSKFSAASAPPFSFVQAAAFQWINPKAWAIAVVAVSAYTTGSGSSQAKQIVWLSLINMAVSVGSCIAWTVCGLLIARLLLTESRRRAFTLAMAGLLVLSVMPLVAFPS